MLVIPAIDLIQGQCVRLYQGDFEKQTVYEANPLEQARLFARAGFRRLHVIDLDGARQGESRQEENPNRAVITQIRSDVSLAIQTGGGIRCSQDVRYLLEKRIDYLILGTALLEDPKGIRGWLRTYGPSSFIAGLDLRDGKLRSRGWIQESSVSIEEAVQRLVEWGVPQVICTDIASDGTLREPSFGLYEKLARLLPTGLLLIAAGGISCPKHISLLRQAGASGAVVGKALYEGEFSLEEWVHAG